MAYDRLNLADLKNLVRERFFRKNLERDARQIKFNKSAQVYRDLLTEIDRQPLLNNRQFLERQQAQQAQQARVRQFKEDIELKKRQQEQKQMLNEAIQREVQIKRLVSRLASDPIRSFNKLQDMNYAFKESDVKKIFQNVNGRYIIEISFFNRDPTYFTLTRENVTRLMSMIIHKVHFLLGNTYGSDQLTEYNDEPIERFKIIALKRFGDDSMVDDDDINVDIKHFKREPIKKPLMSNSNREQHPNDLGQALFREHRKFNAFFSYKNKTDIDLTKYQIYPLSEDSTRNVKELKDEDQCCLMYTLRMNGVSEELLRNVTASLGALQLNVPLSKMEMVAQIIKKRLTIHYWDESSKRVRKGDKKSHMYGREFEEEIPIAQFKNHFFVFEDTKYTSFYIQNKLEIDEYCKKNPTFKLIDSKHLLTRNKGKYYSSEKPKPMNSLELVVTMMDAGLFSDYHVDLLAFASNNYTIEPALSNVNDDQEDFKEHIEFKKKVKKEKKEQKGEPIYLFADCESDVTGKKHEMIAFGFCDMEKNYRVVTYPSRNIDETDSQHQQRFINNIRYTVRTFLLERSLIPGQGRKEQNRPVIMFFHNMKYDATLFGDLFMSTEECCKDGQMYSKSFWLGYGIKVEFRDSLKHFGGKLKDAPETFGLGVSKGEAIGYTFHTKNNISYHGEVSSKKYMKHIKESDHAIFKENVPTDKFNATEYYLEYLKQDVFVLREAMLKYRELILSITELDAFEYLTISSIGHAYAVKQGCYDGLFEVRGCLREFIQQSVKGGRVYVNPEHANKEIDEKVEDFDGVSLYPSSMKRLCQEYGLPKGVIKKSTENSFGYYESKDWYIVKILLKKINKKIQIPCVSIRGAEGQLEYVNEISSPIELYVDRITLKDYIQFQDIEFDILEGIYWDQGFNKKIGQVIEKLHNDRCIYKKTNKPLATMIKLIMNSIYGKTGMRLGETQTSFVSNEKKDEYIYNHFGTISEIHMTPFNTKIIKRTCDKEGSLNYVASAILSMSKHIMNEVFSVMDDNKQPVFYTDTDSIHMLQKDVETLGKAYKEKFGRDLIGKNLGQFHTDFEMEGCKEVHSIKHIPIATKTYLDILQGINEITGEIVFDYHIRIKGITKAGIEYELARRGTEATGVARAEAKIESAISLFRDLKDNKQVTFYLNPTDYDVSFEFSNGNVSTRKTQSFVRILNESPKKK